MLSQGGNSSSPLCLGAGDQVPISRCTADPHQRSGDKGAAAELDREVVCRRRLADVMAGGSEHELRRTGAWDESRQKETDTICPYCGVGCTLTLHTQEDRIVKVTSPLDAPITGGHLCIKGRFGFEFVHPPDPPAAES